MLTLKKSFGQRNARTNQRSNRFSYAKESHADYVQDNYHLRNQFAQAPPLRFKHDYSDYNFVNYNCQIIVKPSADVSFALYEPDILVPWESIAQVHYSLNEELECPICLYPPVLPRMAQCGHVYCLACVSRYIGYDNECKGKKCAICSFILVLTELVKAKVIQKTSVKLGDQVELSLLRREKGSTQSVPYFMSEYHKLSIINADNELLAPYSKVLLASNETMCQTVQSEIDTLQTLIDISNVDEWSQHEVPELKMFMDMLRKELKELQTHIMKASPSKLTMPSAFESSPRISESTQRRQKNCEDQDYMYYQMTDGQDVYMHAANWQCIVKEYPNKNDWPSTIKATVLDISYMRMNPAVRKRWRYLNHIPLGRAFAIIQLDLGPPLISHQTLNELAPVLDKLCAERQKRIEEEKHLTHLKEKVERQIPRMPENFQFAAPINLTKPNMDDFMAIEGSMELPTNNALVSTPKRHSFATVSRVGVASLVDKDRVLHVTKQPAVKKGTRFPVTEEDDWPTLGDSSNECQQSLHQSPATLTKNVSSHNSSWSAGLSQNTLAVSQPCGSWGSSQVDSNLVKQKVSNSNEMQRLSVSFGKSAVLTSGTTSGQNNSNTHHQRQAGSSRQLTSLSVCEPSISGDVCLCPLDEETVTRCNTVEHKADLFKPSTLADDFPVLGGIILPDYEDDTGLSCRPSGKKQKRKKQKNKISATAGDAS